MGRWLEGGGTDAIATDTQVQCTYLRRGTAYNWMGVYYLSYIMQKISS